MKLNCHHSFKIWWLKCNNISSKTRVQLETWIKTKKVSGKVLDIGGSQLPINDRIQHTKDTEFKILDLAVPHEQKQKADLIGDLNIKFEEDNPFELSSHRETFDYAICLEVSEYWYDPLTALRNINKLLKRGGTLFISFHFIYPVHNPINEDMLRYTRQGAIRLLEKAGFEVVHVQPRYGAEGNLRLLYLREQMRPAKGYDFHDQVGNLIEAKKK